MAFRAGKQANGYQESIEKGMRGARKLSGDIRYGKGSYDDQLIALKREIESADAIVIGAGAGLSTSAGFTYSGERFETYFFDFAERFGIRDMYSGGFYPFPKAEIRWAWWARHIYYNRYVDAPKPVFKGLLALVRKKDYFVITTNVDHMFQKAGFDKKRLFYTQGDYGLFQSVNPTIPKTYDNEAWVMDAMAAQGFVRDENGIFVVPEDGEIAMEIPTALIPKCPDDGSDMTTNLRADDSFVEDDGWHRASAAYAAFLHDHKKDHVLYLELGVGANTPVIIKYPFWQLAYTNKKSVYACVNYGEAFCPAEIAERSICLDADIGEVISDIRRLKAGKLTIRRAAASEYPDVHTFYNSLIDAMRGDRYFPKWEKGVYPVPEEMKQEIAAGHLYVGTADGQIAASMVVNQNSNEGYQRTNWKLSLSDNEVMIIHILGVHPDFSGLGFAKAMVSYALDLAKKSGMKAIRLDVVKGNLPAERLYADLGFEYVDTVRMYYEDTGWTDFMMYEFAI